MWVGWCSTDKCSREWACQASCKEASNHCRYRNRQLPGSWNCSLWKELWGWQRSMGALSWSLVAWGRKALCRMMATWGDKGITNIIPCFIIHSIPQLRSQSILPYTNHGMSWNCVWMPGPEESNTVTSRFHVRVSRHFRCGYSFACTF